MPILHMLVRIVEDIEVLRGAAAAPQTKEELLQAAPHKSLLLIQELYTGGSSYPHRKPCSNCWVSMSWTSNFSHPLSAVQSFSIWSSSKTGSSYSLILCIFIRIIVNLP